jgi:hypothetical protein
VAAPIDVASSYRFGIGLGEDDIVGLFAEDIDPTSVGFDAPIGSTLYTNSYGTFRKTSAPTTGWTLLPTTSAGFSPGLTVIVAKSGGQFTSIKAAVDYVTAQVPSIATPWAILVYPGVYIEDKITMPDYTTLRCTGPVGSSTIIPNTTTDAIIACGSNSTVSGFLLFGATGVGGAGIEATAGKSNFIMKDLLIINCETGARVTGSGTPISTQGTLLNLSLSRAPTQVMSTGILVAAGALAVIAGVVITGTPASFVSTGLDVNGASAQVASLSVNYCTTGLRVRGQSGYTHTGFQGRSCTLGIELDGAGTDAKMNSSILDSCTQDITISNAGVTGFYNGAADIRKTDLDAATKFFLNILQFEAGDESNKIVAEFHVGIPTRPSESCFGEGDSDVIGMKVFSNTNGIAGTWLDNTTAAASVDGSTFSPFPGAGAENCFYIGNTLRIFKGIKLEDITPALVLGTGSIVLEYWNGSAWTATPVMETDADPPYGQRANNVFQETGNIQLRFGLMPGWVKNTLNSVEAYWVRFRIVTAVTSVFTSERCKCHTQRSEINRDGFIEYFGDAEQTRQIPLSQLGSLTGFSASSAIIDTNPNTKLQRLYVRRDNNKKDGSGSDFQMPRGLDTSKPITFHIIFGVTSPNTGDVENELFLTRLRGQGGDVLDGTLFTRADSHIQTVGGTDDKTYESEHSFVIDEGLPEDIYYWTQVRDATSGNPDDTYGDDTYLVGWALTGTFWR